MREMARTLTGWRCDWVDGVGNTNFRFDPTYHDQTNKTVYGQTGNFDYTDAVRLCVSHPLHPSFFVTKLWGYFIPTPPDAHDARLAGGAVHGLGVRHRAGGRGDPAAPRLLRRVPSWSRRRSSTTPGCCAAIGRYIDTTDWAWLSDGAGQQLFYPPNVSGWDFTRWLDTSTCKARWDLANYVTGEQLRQPVAGRRVDLRRRPRPRRRR